MTREVQAPRTNAPEPTPDDDSDEPAPPVKVPDVPDIPDIPKVPLPEPVGKATDEAKPMLPLP